MCYNPVLRPLASPVPDSIREFHGRLPDLPQFCLVHRAVNVFQNRALAASLGGSGSFQ